MRQKHYINCSSVAKQNNWIYSRAYFLSNWGTKYGMFLNSNLTPAFAYGIADSKIYPCFKAIDLASCHKGSVCTSHIGQVRMKEMPQMYLHGLDVPANVLQGQTAP